MKNPILTGIFLPLVPSMLAVAWLNLARDQLQS